MLYNIILYQIIKGEKLRGTKQTRSRNGKLWKENGNGRHVHTCNYI